MTAVSQRHLELLLVLFAFSSSAYFYNGYGWNQMARFDPIWAFVEPGPNQHTLRIDDFLPDPEGGVNTGDFAHNPDHSPHYYSNKAPGTTLLGIPFYAALYHAERALAVDPVSIRNVHVNAYLIHLWVTVLPVALSALFFFRLARYLSGRPERAALLTLLLYGGTLMLPFSTAMFAHTTAAAFGIIALSCFVVGGAGTDERERRRSMMLAGLFAGLAVVMDYGAAPLAISLVVACLVVPDRRLDARAVVLGGLAPAVVFAAYHWALFGSPIRLASSYSPAELLIEGDVLGMFGRLRPRALWGLTFSSARGIFFFMPVLALALWTFRHVRSLERHRSFAWLALANVTAVLLINLSYNTWWGGVNAGARYQIIALPFYVALLALLPDKRWVRRGLYALGAVSVANMFVIASVSPMAPDAYRGSPLFFSWAKVLWALKIDLGIDPPAPTGAPLSQGSLHIYANYLMRDWGIALTDPVVERWASFNLGERALGLRGTWSLLPALVGGAGMWAWVMRLARSGEGAGEGAGEDAGRTIADEGA